MKKKGWTGIFRRKQYVIAGTLVIIAAIGTTVLYSNRQEKERQQMEAQFAEELNQSQQELAEVPATEEEELQEAAAVVPPKTETEKETAEKKAAEKAAAEKAAAEKAAAEKETEEAKAAETAKAEETAESAKTAGSSVEALHFSEEKDLMWPMEGDVIMNYSMDSTVYFATLDQYKYNPAVIIAGEVNDKVYSAARGQIQGIENDEVTGCTVTVNLGDGYQAIYGQLKELNFEVGDYVEAGHVLGYISEPTKYYSVEGSNLYFELLKDGAPVDPVEYLE